MKKGQREILQILAILVLGIGGLKIGSLWEQSETAVSWQRVGGYLVPLATMFVITAYLKMWKQLGIRASGWKSLLTKGWYVIGVSLIFGFLNLISLSDAVKNQSDGSVWGAFLLTCLFTGMFEEICFRGLIQNLCCRYVEHTGRTHWAAIVAASGIFALLHLMNLIEKPYFIVGTITQVFYTFSLGMLLGVIYYLSKNLSVVILLHALFNALGSFTDIYLPAHTQNADISIFAMIIQLVLMLPGIFVAYRLYKNQN